MGGVKETRGSADLQAELEALRSRMAELSAAESECRQAREALEQQSAYLEALHETALGLLRRREGPELLEAIVLRAGALVGTEHGYVYLKDAGGSEEEETMTVRIGTGIFRRCVGLRLRKGEGLAGQVWARGAPVVVDSYAHWSGRLPNPEYDALGAVVGLPLRAADAEVLGVLALAHLDPDLRFHPTEVRALERFAELASVALDNARLWEELRRAEERYRGLFDRVPVGLYRTTADGRFLDANPALVEIFGFPDRASLLRCRVQELYVNPEDRDRWKSLLEREGVVRNFEVRLRRLDGREIWVRDSARIVSGEREQGICYEGRIEDITEQKRWEEVKRRVAQRILEAQEQERLHLARELHDTLGQLLTALKMDAEWIARRAHRLSEARELARELCQRLDRAMESVRALSRGLRPAMLDWGLGPALEALVEEMKEQSGSQGDGPRGWNLTLRGPLEELPRETALALYRIAQEALTNVLRHAQARCVQVTLAVTDGQATLRVEDDGRGIPEEALNSPYALGIVGMRERAELLGGTLRVERRRPRGTSVLAEIPLSVGRR